MRTLAVLCLAVFVLGGVAAAVVSQRYQTLQYPLNLAQGPVEHVIEVGTSFAEVARALHAKQVLDSPRWLVWYARWQGLAGRIKAGEYRITSGMSPLDVLDALVRGDVIQRQMTLLEGWTFKQVMAAVANNPYLEHTLTGLPPDTVMQRLGYAGVHPEGMFFPETYHFPRGTRDVEFLQRAYRVMKEKLHDAWSDRDEGLPFDDPYDALILASIVEKETGHAGERARIAGVFIRRLQRGMRLEADPTVIYGLGEDFDGDIRRGDLRKDTPYNTYVRSGLPPTPIAMPGGDTLRATVHPEAGSDLFFVATGDGSHYFSSTYTEHRKAVQKFQIQRRRTKREEDRSDASQL